MIFEGAPAVIGHRGSGSSGGNTGAQAPLGAGEHPGENEENTVRSIEAAVRAGARWVEIDVQRTADDELVLRHNPWTSGGEFVVERAAAQTGLPRLAEVLDGLPDDIALDIDVKTILEDAVDPPARRTARLLMPVLAREARRRPLLVTSFDPALLLEVRRALPDVPVGLLTWVTFPIWHAVAAAAGLGLDAVGVHTGSCGLDGPSRFRPLRHTVEVAHRAGLEFLAWCPKADEAPGYAEAGVDAVVVDDVPGVLAALAR